MTIRKTRAGRKPLGSFSPERKKVRTLLRKAAQGNVHAFAQAASNYTNLISEYLFFCGHVDKAERQFELRQILCDCWRYLPYTRRVSDFERFLQVRLERVPVKEQRQFQAPHQSLSRLSHEGRFLLAARILNDWTVKSLRLSLRINKEQISQSMMELRCRLTSVDLSRLNAAERSQILQVSELFEGGYGDKQCRKIEKEISKQYHAHQFKADWITYRCELADLQTEMQLSSEENFELMESVTTLIRQQPMEKPRLYDSIVNQFSFVRLPLL